VKRRTLDDVNHLSPHERGAYLSVFVPKECPDETGDDFDGIDPLACTIGGLFFLRLELHRLPVAA
jgi:hypothetical protein